MGHSHSIGRIDRVGSIGRIEQSYESRWPLYPVPCCRRPVARPFFNLVILTPFFNLVSSTIFVPFIVVFRITT